MEIAALKLIEDHPHLNDANHTITHNFNNESYCLTGIEIDEFVQESKSMFLDTPKIGGIIGLGIQSKLSRDAIFSIVIDSILTTLINLVGSVKAIHKYTDSLEYYATRDPLTNFFNQRVFRDMMGYEIKRATRHKYKFGLLVIDLDNFKYVNDTYGHSFGDSLLQSIADVIENVKRSEDIASRFGGDEFTLILPESDDKQIYTVAERVNEAIRNFSLQAPNDNSVTITASIEIAIYPDHADQENSLFNVADSMMYRAKSEGKNTIRYASHDDLEIIYNDNNDKAMLVLDAITHQRIIPHYQPIMALKDDTITIHELLMRIDIENNTINAGAFIEKAEELGVVHQMDYICIEKALAKMQESAYEDTLFINLSPKALIVNEFLVKINDLIHKYQIKKEQIVFEITERETVKSFSLLEKFVNNLKLEGYRFAIDDFGSGFSSFHYIKKFPIDFIKIDGEFILNLSKDKKDLAFVKSIIALAKELEVYTVAEFVVQYLRDIGIDYVQGFHIAKPSSQFTSRAL
jgi:diguanylate cyclase (GGDEF)-like protein